MSEFSRRNLACSSWHRCPEGWQSWSGMVHGYTTRPFCSLEVGHTGDHQAPIESVEDRVPGVVTLVYEDGRRHRDKEVPEMMPEQSTMTWPNKLGIPNWLLETTRHGLRMIRGHVYERDQTECEYLDMALDVLDPFLEDWPSAVYGDEEEE